MWCKGSDHAAQGGSQCQVYVLEYLLDIYCPPDDQEITREGLKKLCRTFRLADPADAVFKGLRVEQSGHYFTLLPCLPVLEFSGDLPDLVQVFLFGDYTLFQKQGNQSLMLDHVGI